MLNRKLLSNAVKQFLITFGLVCLFWLIIGGALAIMLVARVPLIIILLTILGLLLALIYYYSANETKTDRILDYISRYL